MSFSMSGQENGGSGSGGSPGIKKTKIQIGGRYFGLTADARIQKIQVQLEDGTMEELIETSPPATPTQRKRGRATNQRTMLDSVLYGIKEHLKFEGTIEELLMSQEFMTLMRSWESRPKFWSTEKFATPIQIYHPPAHLNDGVQGTQVGVKWQDERLFMKLIIPGEKFIWAQPQAKCKFLTCTAVAKINQYCSSHCNGTVLVIREDFNAEVSAIAVLKPERIPTTLQKWTSSDMVSYVQSKGSTCGALRNYIEERQRMGKRMNFKIIMIKTLEQEHVKGYYHAVMGAMSIFTMVNNSQTDNKVHFINSSITVDSVDMKLLENFLKLNGISFQIGDKDDSVKIQPSPFLPSSYKKRLPHSYIAIVDDGNIYDGLRVALCSTGSTDGSAGHEYGNTALSKLDPDSYTVYPIYQMPLTPDQSSEMQKSTSINKMTPYQKDVFLQMENKAQRMETLGHVSTFICNMKKMNHGGKKIKNLVTKWTHYDDAFTTTIFTDLFVMKSGQRITTSFVPPPVDNSGKLLLKWE